MVTKTLIDEYFLVAKELFDKNYLNIGIGSLSLKLKTDQMLINKKNKHYIEEDFVKKVYILRENMAWKEASEDVKIHSEIYKQNSNIKAIAHIFPKNVMTFAEKNYFSLDPIDFLGKKNFTKIPIIEIGSVQEWEENNEFIIAKNLKDNDILIIKGFGVFIKARDLREIIKLSTIIENSAYILLNSN
ncbi:hypothetical protein JCM11957_02650 [Caminibacter profundus]